MSAASAGNIVVVKTPAGLAQGLAAIIDASAFEGILGSVAGDDTIMMVAQDEETARQVSGYIASHSIRK